MRVADTERIVHIVDDDLAVRRSLEKLLHSAGFSCVIYETALGFLEAAPQLSAGCVLLDIRMPEMDGLEVQARLNQLNFSLPVIVITGQGDIQTAVLAMKAGAVDFIEKPSEDERLIAAIEAAQVNSGRTFWDQEVVEAAGRIAKLSRREREVLDASEIQMIIEGKDLPARVDPNAPTTKDEVQQVLKPAPGQQPSVSPGERPAQA